MFELSHLAVLRRGRRLLVAARLAAAAEEAEHVVFKKLFVVIFSREIRCC